ncbi:MAG: amino acid carrier protein [Clostridia bacterium]|nr:amino acid carrier protein [Clostridia bacterium]
MESLSMLLLLGCGCVLTLRLRFIQFRRPFAALRTLGRRAPDGGVSPFEALATSLGACIGTGNIAGVAGAILLGGPGALLWMWLSAFVCSASKYAEIYFAQRLGGSPMDYMERGLPKRLRFLSPAYALCCMAGCVCMGNLVQVNTVAEAVQSIAAPYDLRLYAGLLIAALTALVTFGGARRVGRAAAFLVPFMSALYILGALAVILAHLPALPAALAAIFRGAFMPRALTGGAVGFAAAFRTGMSRGVFTHEAGVGTAALAHGAVKGNHPHAQALLGVFEVFFDTIVLCSLTGLAILVSGVPLPYGDASVNSALVIEAFQGVLGGAAGPFIAGSLALFAFTSILSFSLYGTICAERLFGRKARLPFRLAFCLLLIAGALLSPALAWRATETLNALLAVINGAALLLLSRRRGGG